MNCEGLIGLESPAKDVLSSIDEEELLKLIIDLGNIESPYGLEREAAEFVATWLGDNGFKVKTVGMLPERPNVAGILRGGGTGKTLIFNGHLDTAVSPHDTRIHRNPSAPFYTSAWCEDDQLFGEGVQNDKGPLACTLIAAKALKESGVRLAGDVIVTAVSGETGLEPVDEFQGPSFLGKDAGTRYLLTHGGIWGDYALVAEGTDFGLAWVEAGKAFFKVTVYGETTYTPWLNRDLGHNTVVNAARVIQAIDRWGEEFSIRRKNEYDGGTVFPKVQVSAVRGGAPYYVTKGCEFCEIYVDVRLLPGEDPRVPWRELRAVLEKMGIRGEVDMFLHRRGYEAHNPQGLVEALMSSHEMVFGEKPKRAAPPFSSMWRDTNVFNEMGIPAVTYGPKRRCPIPVSDMVMATKVYALTALMVCGLNL